MFKNITGFISKILRLGTYIKSTDDNTSLALMDSTNTAYTTLTSSTSGSAEQVAQSRLTSRLIRYYYPLRFNNPCTVGPPANTSLGTHGYGIATTGNGGTIKKGDILYDTGVLGGGMTVIAAVSGTILQPIQTDGIPLLTMRENKLYAVATDTTQQNRVSENDIVRKKLAIGSGKAGYASTWAIPKSAIVSRCDIAITTIYPVTATISVGYAGSSSFLFPTTKNYPRELGTYTVKLNKVWTSTAALYVATNYPASGAGEVTVWYTI